MERKEHPIIFSAPMVRAILENRKTQTRRICKPQPEAAPGWNGAHIFTSKKMTISTGCINDCKGKLVPNDPPSPCPYGQPGDRLWVRETWAHCLCDMGSCCGYLYRASGETPNPGDKWKPSIHMSRKAARILLEVVSVRVERLQDISDEDCRAEGIECWQEGNDKPTYRCGDIMQFSARLAYADLFDSIHGRGAWNGNPWVWVVEFRRVDA